MENGMSIDDVILQIFEEHPDKFTFPLVSHKQARDFVRLLNRNGLTYEMVAEAVGEKLNYFENWRLISGEDNAIGNKVIKRLNRPLQDTILIDDDADDDGETDKVKLLLFNGMSIDIDEDAERSLKALDEKRHKQALEVLRVAKEAETADLEKKQKEQKAEEDVQNKKNDKAKVEAQKEADKNESLKNEEKEDKKDPSLKVESPKIESQSSSNISKYKVLEVKPATKTNGESTKSAGKVSENGTADVPKQTAVSADTKSTASAKTTSESASVSTTSAKSSSTPTSVTSNHKQEESVKASVTSSPDSSTANYKSLESNKTSGPENKTLKSAEIKPKSPESPSPGSPALSTSLSSPEYSKSINTKTTDKNDVQSSKDATTKSAELSSPPISTLSSIYTTASTTLSPTSPSPSTKALLSTPVTTCTPQATSTSPTSPSVAKSISSNPPSTPISKTSITATELSTSPAIIDENYDSDLDSEEVDKKSDQAKMIDNVYKYKNLAQDGPGFVYILSDTSGSKPVDALSGIHRIRIGASRFPQKRFQQAQLFNPDLRLVTSKHVTKRRAALSKLEEELASMLYRNTPLWYRGGIEKILEALEGLI